MSENPTNEPIPDLGARELLAVCTVAEYGSFMAASLTLGVSQPALTRTVQRVERAVGLELFHRSTRRVEITAAGQEFIALANRVLADLRISFGNMRELSDEQRGKVFVSSVMSVAYVQLPRVVAGYRETRSGIELQVREGVHGTVLEDVRSGLADLGLTYVDELPAGFTAIALGREAFHVVMPQGHPLTRGASLDVERLAAYPLVSLPRESQTRRLIDGLAAVGGTVLRNAVTVSQFSTLMQFVHAGVGIAIVPGGAVPAARQANLATRPLARPRLTRTIGAVHLAGRALTPSARGFLAYLRRAWSAAGKGAAGASSSSGLSRGRKPSR